MVTGSVRHRSERAARLRRRARGLRWCAAALLTATVGVAWWAVGDALPVVIGDLVVGPALVGPLAALLGSGAALTAAMTEARAQASGARPGSGRWFVRWPVNVVKACVLAVGWLGAVVSFVVGVLDDDVRVLEPASERGCRVVVVQHLWGGTIHVLPRGTVRPPEVGSYGADDGYQPVSRATFDLSWTGETGSLVLRGAPGMQVWQHGAETVDCPSR